MSINLTGDGWVKSSYSQSGGECIEWAPGQIAQLGAVLVRDSKDPEGPQLHFSREAWAAFARAAGGGEFDTV